MTSPTLTLAEIDRRENISKNALANQRLAGLQPHPLAIEQARRWKAGEITIQMAIGAFASAITSGSNKS